MDGSKWDWLDSASGAVAGMFTGIGTFYGIFAKRMALMDNSIDGLTKTAATQGTSIAVLEAHHNDKMHRLDRIENNLQSINDKQDRQMEILVDLSQR